MQNNSTTITLDLSHYKENSKGFLTEEEMEILALMSVLMKKYKKIGYQHPEDQSQIVKAVHIIQDLIIQRIARKAEPIIFPIKS